MLGWSLASKLIVQNQIWESSDALSTSWDLTPFVQFNPPLQLYYRTFYLNQCHILDFIPEVYR